MKKRLLIMSAVLAMTISSLAGCGSSSKAVEIPKLEEKDTEKVQKKTYEFDEEGYVEIAGNKKYVLSIDKTYNTIRVRQVSTGKEWKTSIDGVKAEADRSLFKMSYYNSTAKEANPAQRYSAKMKGAATYEIKDDSGNVIGMRVDYKDSSLDLGITLDIILTEDGIRTKIPAGGVKEEGDFKVISIDLLSNLAAAKNSEEGYYLYPDGSGAIMEFQDAAHQTESNVEYKIYGDITQYKNMLGEWDEPGDEVFLPIFGAKIADQSFLGIVEKGEETASIWIQPKADDGVNKMWCTFTFRNLFNDVRKDKDGQNVVTKRYDSDMTDMERSVSYNFFDPEEDDNVTYADMAVKYREYLMKECGLEKKEDDKAVPISMDIFLGINEEGTIRDSFKAVTTFKQAEEMIDELKEKKVDNVEIQLKGWTKNGYFTDPAQFPANSKIGGNKGLCSLADKYKDDKGVSLCLETNLMEAKADADGYDTNTEIVIAGDYTPVSDQESKRYLLSPNVAAGNLNKLLEDIKDKKVNVDGLSFYSLGQYVTYNYTKDNKITKSQCKKIWENMLQTAHKQCEDIIVQGGNQYVLPYADKVTDIPYDDSGYRITTKSVPVFQIAMHGLVNYTGDALNLSSDKEEEKLKWVEYGYIPYFELTYSGSEQLMHTDYSELFSSTFSSWVDEATKIYKELNEGQEGQDGKLLDVWNMFIIDHEEVQSGVYKVTYQSQDKKKTKVVYVNYNDVECKVDGNVIENNSYLVK